ncbi:MAG: hypothetical protein HRT90_04125, partial [Candidatus Margulisbacteria bacterium]|nr:hypothetical protein [Candidatus Margulisiibacteriota bacterium]
VVGQASGRRIPCRIGSVKTNMGHLGGASGMASVIKVALSMYHGYLPPTLNLKKVNTGIDLENLHLQPQLRGEKWKTQSNRPPLAGVHVTSLSGLNAHLVLEGYIPSKKQTSTQKKGPFLMVLSARSQSSLLSMAKVMVTITKTLDIADICHTMALHRTHFECRLGIMGDDYEDIRNGLNAYIHHQSYEGLYVGAIPESPSETNKRADTLQEVAQLFVDGHDLPYEWFSDTGSFVRLPTYQWDKERCWPEWLEGPILSQPFKVVAKEQPPASPKEDLRKMTVDQQRKHFTKEIQSKIIHLMGIKTIDELNWKLSFQELGIDSFTAVSLTRYIQQLLNKNMSISLLFNHSTLPKLVNYLIKEMGEDDIRSLMDEKMKSMEGRYLK